MGLPKGEGRGGGGEERRRGGGERRGGEEGRGDYWNTLG